MDLTLSIVQMDVQVSQPAANLKKAEVWMQKAVAQDSQLICFPEMWTTGFNWATNKQIAQEQEEIIEQIAALAKKYGLWINGSTLALNKDGQLSNTSILFDNDGQQVATYRKTHLFSLLHEDEHLAPGEHLTLVDTPWGLAGLSICYDIRFPELFRTYALQGAKFILSPMAFPYPRLAHWQILVRARAIENQLYMIGSNHVGNEDFGPAGKVTYFGHSCIIDPWGDTVVEAGETKEELLTTTINLDRVDEIRAQMTVLQDRRPALYDLNPTPEQ